jgi:hypothetical protein
MVVFDAQGGVGPRADWHNLPKGMGCECQDYNKLSCWQIQDYLRSKAETSVVRAQSSHLPFPFVGSKYTANNPRQTFSEPELSHYRPAPSSPFSGMRPYTSNITKVMEQ